MLGTYALRHGYYEAYYKKALRVRRLIRRNFDEAFKACDCLMGPTSPTAAFRIGERAADPLTMYLSNVYTVSSNLAGSASVSLPCGLTAAGLPVGLQILTDVFTEEKLLRIARMYERECDWSTRVPPAAGAETRRASDVTGGAA